jgi:hypothetical protein
MSGTGAIRGNLNSANPSMHNFQAWTFDPASGGASAVALTAATIYLNAVQIVNAFTCATITFNCQVSGTGAVALSNAQCGLYSSTGVLLGYSTAADMADGGSAEIDEMSPGAPLGRTVTLTANGAGALALSAGTTVYAAIHIGTQASTPAQIAFGTNAGTTVANLGMTATLPRTATATGHASNPLLTIGNLTMASNALFTRVCLMGLA